LPSSSSSWFARSSPAHTFLIFTLTESLEQAVSHPRGVNIPEILGAFHSTKICRIFKTETDGREISKEGSDNSDYLSLPKQERIIKPKIPEITRSRSNGTTMEQKFLGEKIVN